MSNQQEVRKKGVLVLEDADYPEGLSFSGWLFGAPVNAKALEESKDRGYGEVVFNTSMTGYQEILTDPSYYGQMICMTYPHIGNTGVNLEDPESKGPQCAGFIIHDLTEVPSSWRSQQSLEDYLIEHRIPGILGVDTRALTRHLRSKGVVRGVILEADERHMAPELLKKLPSFEGRDLIAEVSTPNSYLSSEPVIPPPDGRPYRVVVLDFGMKKNMLRLLARMGCEVEVMPAHSSAEEILKKNPEGVFLSNGPGDPSAAPYAAESVRTLLGKSPIFGVCMGHQILSHAVGGKTFKLKFGHRGANQPVLEKTLGNVEISSQNHGYAVDPASLPDGVEVTHVHLNDGTVAGMQIPAAVAFSVQYHPEACPGPHDSLHLFDRFLNAMKTRREAKLA